jgi:hypothetical protein
VLAASVVLRTKSRIACLAFPSLHDDKGSVDIAVVCALAGNHDVRTTRTASRLERTMDISGSSLVGLMSQVLDKGGQTAIARHDTSRLLGVFEGAPKITFTAAVTDERQ